MMTRDTITAAIAEAERFVERAKALLAVEVNTWDYRDGSRNLREWKLTSDAPKEQGAVRRASMDLTRSLAEMRRRS